MLSLAGVTALFGVNVLFDFAMVRVVSVRMFRSITVGRVIVVVIAVVRVTVLFEFAVVCVVSVCVLWMVVASICVDVSRRHLLSHLLRIGGW